MNELIINDWKTLVDFIENSTDPYPDVLYNHIQFRGQSKCDWNLSNGLLRIIDKLQLDEKKANGYEMQAQMKFLSHVHLFDSKINYSNSAEPHAISIDMQHYSCPTRLLDWSQSPYVALYFAINQDFDSDGALFCWDVRYYRKHLKLLYPNETFEYEKDFYSKNKTPFVSVIYSTRNNDRLMRQQGVFSISNYITKGHDDIIIETAVKAQENSGLYKLIISKDLKVEFLSRLIHMNISAKTLFSDLDGLGKSIKEELTIRNWMKQ